MSPDSGDVGVGVRVGTAYARWAALVSSNFTFAVKMPREIGPGIERFLGEVASLALLHKPHTGKVASEPRHATWFTAEADACLARFTVARVTADAAVVPQAIEPRGWPELVHYRLHGSPETYTLPYPDDYLFELATRRELSARDGEPWCIFDNTAPGTAAARALALAPYHS